jgi:hypothetical protein
MHHVMDIYDNCFPFIDSQNSSKADSTAVIMSDPSNLLHQTCDLIRNFSDYLDVVVSVARKTDGRHWSDLFTAAGKSTEYETFTSQC